MSGQSSNDSKSSKRNRNKNQQMRDDEAMDVLSKDEKQIARHLRFNAPKKQANLHSTKVDFFMGNKIIDFLLESEWGPGKSGTNKKPLFANRQACVAFMQRLMNKQLFYRAVKVYKEDVVASGTDSAEQSTPSVKKRKAAQSVDSSPSTEQLKKTKESPQQQQQSNKRKFKLEIDDVEQKFVDANEPYAWFYDPTSTKSYIIGSLLILGAIGICLFPLWPSQVRDGVYYVSLAGASFLGAILGLAVLKYVIFAVVWACTFGNVHFWLFPNLTEDVGFLESFVPVYKYTLSSSSNSSSSISQKSNPIDEVAAKNDDEQTATINDLEIVDNGNKLEKSSTADLTKSVRSLATSSNELSNSTVEISKLVNTDSEEPIESQPKQQQDPLQQSTLIKRRKSSTNKEDDGFELVDDDDLNK